LILGSTESFGAGGLDAWLIKTDSAGNKVWEKTFGGKCSDRGESMQQASDGGYLLAGETHCLNSKEDELWIIKLVKN